jgi:hypothetical protein
MVDYSIPSQPILAALKKDIRTAPTSEHPAATARLVALAAHMRAVFRYEEALRANNIGGYIDPRERIVKSAAAVGLSVPDFYEQQGESAGDKYVSGLQEETQTLEARRAHREAALARAAARAAQAAAKDK